MQSKKLAGKKVGVSTRERLDIAEIREDCVVLKDGTMRAVMIISSINFSLKSEEEQNAIIAAYVSFLNAIEFPLQIVIQSRKLNIDAYLERLRKAEKEQTNDLLRIQIADYREYIKELVELSDKRKGFWSRLNEVIRPGSAIKLGAERFRKRKKDLFARVEHVQMLLSGMGLTSVILDTQSLIELYYNLYNPELAETEKMVDMGKLRVGE